MKNRVFVYDLTLLFIGLQLTDNISWNWFFIVLPAILGYTSAVIEEIRKRVEK